MFKGAHFIRGPLAIGQADTLAPGIHFIGWVSPSAGLDTMAKRKFAASAGNQTPVDQSVAKHYTDRVPPAHLL
jgi:hypothetical protein